MRGRWRMRLGAAALGAVVSMALASAASANSVVNGDFETDELNPLVYIPSVNAAPGVFGTNAPSWIGISSTGATAVAQVVRGFNPTFAFDDNAIWVTVGDGSSGVANIFAPAPPGAPAQSFEADVYLLGGSVAIGLTISGGGTVQQVVSTPHTWVHVSGIAPVDPAGLHNVFFALSDGGTANFFLDNVVVTAVPEPGTALLGGLGLAGLALAGRRRANG